MRVGAPDGFGFFGVLDRTEDTVVCHECGQAFRSLVQHLHHKHAMSTSDYRRAHGLPASLPLTCLSTSRTISTQGRSHVGTDAWRDFEEGRSRTLPTSQKAATRASTSDPAPATTQRRQEIAREQFSGIRETWRADQWRATLAEVAQFHLSAGRWPTRGPHVGPVEARLGEWLTNQRGLARRGRQAAWKLQALTDAGIDLNPGRGRRRA